jgi:phospholipid/cholesterol/gamma-HCH transport system substrate-binding protein
MHLTRRIKLQFVMFGVISLAASMVMVFGYMKLPTMLGVGRYDITVELPKAGGLYPTANVTYRGTEVGRVKSVDLDNNGVVSAVLTLRSDVKIPSDLDAQVHSQSAIGEQYVALLPRNGDSPALKNGDVIARDRSSVPPDINALLDSINHGLQVIPQQNLQTVVDESFTAVGGLGPELSRIVKGSTQLAIDARQNLDSLTTLIDQSQPVLDSQIESADSVQAWAAHLANVSGQLRNHDSDLVGVLEKGPPAAEAARQLIERLQPTLPVLLANLVSIGHVALAYQPALEQLLVLFPQGVANMQGLTVANADTKQDYKGLYLDFHLNLNLPPVCTTGFLPAQQQRTAVPEDYPDRAPGDLYCRIPQDAPFNVRGARNYPCLTVPGKRAATVKECESDKQYVPLNDGFNWKGDPNATTTGQSVPELPPDAPSEPPSPPLAAAEYDPATGTYAGPDGKIYRQSDLANTAPKEKTWQSMLTPPTGN